MIKIEIKKQLLYFLKDGRIFKQYPISTSKYGIGNLTGSKKTPLGRHKIVRKIGDGSPLGTIFAHRRNQRRIARIFSRKSKIMDKMDLITTRILRLRGLESGVNKDEGVDSYKRCIYIHGTPQEWLIGTPASHGCIRMRNRDIVEVFDVISSGELVLIEK